VKRSRKRLDAIARARLPEGYDLDRLRNMQKILASRVVERDVVQDPEKICGIDLAYVKEKGKEIGIACAVVCNRHGEIIDRSCRAVNIEFPYIPTLLSLRELRPMVVAFRSLRERPDIVMIDGHGKAHPYRLGIASHFGVVMKVPTIGCAKSLLYGELSNCREDQCDIVDPENGEIIGRALKHYNKYVYVSVGNLVTLDTACRVVREMLRTRSQMPLPILYAHNMCNEYKRRVIRGTTDIERFL